MRSRSTGLGPGRLLDALDGYSERHDVGLMTTLVYAQLGLGSRRLRYACAGHPPPVILSPGDDASLRVGGALGPARTSSRLDGPRGGAALTLAPGSTVLLYTDGLIERR